MQQTQKHFNNPDIPRPAKQREIEPRFEHLNGLRHTINDIISIQRVGEHATRSMIGSHKHQHDPRTITSKAADEYTATKDPGDSRHMYGSLLAGIPSFADAISKLPDNHEWSPLSYEERQTEIMKTIAFNDRIKQIINHNPRLAPDTLMTVVKGVVEHYNYGQGRSHEIIDRVWSSIRGMQHELAFESVLYYLPEGFEIMETTGEDDAHGADYIVRAPNGRIVVIDVKATERQADKSYQRKVRRLAKHGKKPPQNELIIATGFTGNDFRNDYPWRVKDSAIQNLLPHVTQQIMLAAGMEISELQYA